jgi:hypothetical protein
MRCRPRIALLATAFVLGSVDRNRTEACPAHAGAGEGIAARVPVELAASAPVDPLARENAGLDAGLRAAFDAGQRAAFATPDGHRARDRAPQWTTTFDVRSAGTIARASRVRPTGSAAAGATGGQVAYVKASNPEA